MAYIAGFEWALERDYDIICEFDADGSHRPLDLEQLLSVARSEWPISSSDPGGCQEGAIVDWPKSRYFLFPWSQRLRQCRHRAGREGCDRRLPRLRSRSARSARSLGRAITGILLPDRHDLSHRRSRLPVAEVPIVFVERELGESKMSGSIISEAFTKVAGWGLDRRRRQLRRLLGGDRSQRAEPA